MMKDVKAEAIQEAMDTNAGLLKSKVLFFCLCAFLFLDAAYSFYQHSNVSLDGDMAGVIMPSPGYAQVLEDPFAVNVLVNKESYAAPNRFFAHYSMYTYFRGMPAIMQVFFDPIDSVYLATGFAKTFIQLLIILAIALYISGMRKGWKKDGIFAAALITPLFQTTGFNGSMGIIEVSPTYTFFYALPTGLLLLFFFPFFRMLYHGERVKFGAFKIVMLLAIILVSAFNGPLSPGIVLIVCFLIIVTSWAQNYRSAVGGTWHGKSISSIWQIHPTMLTIFILFGVLSLYSLYIGTFNSENISTKSLYERFLLLPQGVWNILTDKLGVGLLLLTILANAYIIYTSGSDSEGKKVLNILKWIGIFVALYLLLLPFGGYRDYRPYILRRDTIVPVTLCLIFFYGLSSLYILKNVALNYKKWYLAYTLAFLIFFTIADEPVRHMHNACEREALEIIASSTEKIVPLESDCYILSWGKMAEPGHSQGNGRLLKLWGITKEEKLYFQK